ncbi:hypothetical protein GTP55_28875 [Duganella sp. FT109W]|uniref:DUF2219 family protein n=1 Tax=Duganella margarita TaxID=2692170 RepID=A0ABW9WQ32_9BURK|nr:hypothetical protein [Duganella margarita]MYN43364.1 hypothetical protein [Duganella margarita]
MNKFSLTLATASLFGADALAADPPTPPSTFPWYEPRASGTLLFDVADRQTALAETLQQAGTRRFSVVSGVPQLHFGALPDNPGLLDPLGPVLNERGKRWLSSADFEKKMGRGTGILTVGILREAGGAPGMQQSMSMMLNTRPTTTFTSLSLGYALTPRSALMAMASYGKTEGIGSPDSLLAQVSSVRTVAYSAGYVRRQWLAENDRLALTLSIPARVRTGTLEYSGAAVNLAPTPAALALGVPTLNLRPTATERDLEFSYTRLFGREGSKGRLTGALMWRVNPGHDANAPVDALMGVRYSYGF